jgi:glycosyltransferase involved in cell wall biosynthesis
VARHSGLAEIAERLEAAYPPEHRHLASFAPQDVADLRRTLAALLELPAEEWAVLSQAVRRTAEREWSWVSVADRIARLAAEAT